MIKILICQLWLLTICAQDIDIEHIRQTKTIRVVGESQQDPMEEGFQKTYFTIEIEDKNKKRAYELVLYKFNQILKKFRQKSLIPEDSSMTGKQIEARMNKKRRLWNFKQKVTFLSELNDAKLIQKYLRGLGIKHFGHYPIQKQHHSQKALVSKAFKNAKEKANEILSELGYKVSRVENVEILGNKMVHEQKIEEEIEEEYNQIGTHTENQTDDSSSDDESEQKDFEVTMEYSDYDETTEQVVRVEVIFRVTRESESEDSGEL